MTLPTQAPAVEARPPELTWRVEGFEPQRLAAVPTLDFRLTIGAAGGAQVQCIALSTSVRIKVALRSYDAPTQERLTGVFGQPHQWSSSLRELVWTQPTIVVPPFTGATTVNLPVPCSSDMDLAANSYLHALRDGDVPLRFMFNGSVFYPDAMGRLQTAQIPWEAEADFTMPAVRWHELRQRYFGDQAWLGLGTDSFDRLKSYRTRYAYPSWDSAIDALLSGAIAPDPDSTRPG